MVRPSFLAHVAAATVVRKLTMIALLAVLGWVGLGRAHAQDAPSYANCSDSSYSGTYCSSEAEARSVLAGFAQATKEALINGPWGGTPGATVCAATKHGPYSTPPYGMSAHIQQAVASNADCTALAQSWTRTFVVQDACPGGYKRDLQNQCMNEDKCKALNSEPGFDPNAVRDFVHAKNAPSNSFCPSSGCAYVRTGQVGGTTCVGGECVTQGSWNYPGPSCSTAPADPNFQPVPPEGITVPPDPGRCTRIGGNQGDMCIKPDGRKCIQGKAKEFCWKPGETGEKTQENELQKENPGPTTILPNLTLPNGDVLIHDKGPIVTEHTPNAPGKPTATTTNNTYITGSGTNAGPPGTDSGAPGEPGGGDGEGEDEEGNKTGGSGECGAGWAPSGDAILAAQLTEAHRLRCLGEDAKEADEGDADSLDSAANGITPDGAEGMFGEADTGAGLNSNFLSLGGGGCPNLSFNLGVIGTVTAPPIFCEIVAAIAMLFQLAAYVWGLRLVME